jgi:protein-tyrosine phosphatase
VALRSRTLAWDGCLNVRDLGGHPTEDGGETRYGVVVRADSVRALTAGGWRALVDYGITRIVDLRQHSELAADPPVELPVELVHVPLFPEPGSAHWEEIAEVARDAAPDGISEKRLAYLECLERFRPEFGAALTALAQAAGGGVVVHCQAGKDRTGLVSALLLRLAGVSREEVGADYAVTEENLRAAWEPWVDAAVDEDDRLRRRRLAGAPAEAMVGVLTELERRYGSVRDYARAGGTSEADLDALVTALRR